MTDLPRRGCGTDPRSIGSEVPCGGNSKTMRLQINRVIRNLPAGRRRIFRPGTRLFHAQAIAKDCATSQSGIALPCNRLRRSGFSPEILIGKMLFTIEPSFVRLAVYPDGPSVFRVIFTDHLKHKALGVVVIYICNTKIDILSGAVFIQQYIPRFYPIFTSFSLLPLILIFV